MSVRPPLFFFFFFLFLSPSLRSLVSSHSFSLNLASFPLCEDPSYFHSLCLSIFGPEVLGLCRRFSERLRSMLPINVLAVLREKIRH